MSDRGPIARRLRAEAFYSARIALGHGPFRILADLGLQIEARETPTLEDVERYERPRVVFGYPCLGTERDIIDLVSRLLERTDDD